MSASYPSSIWTPTVKTDKVDLVAAEHINRAQEEIVALQTEIGALIKGNATDLVARLAVMINNNGAIQSGTSFPGTTYAGQLFFRTDLDQLYIRDAANANWINAGTPSHAAGDVLTAFADTEFTAGLALYTKKKEILVPKSGVLRIKFDMHSSSSHTSYGLIYRNGVAIGTERTTTSSTYQTYSEDIAGWIKGDLCQLYIKISNTAGSTSIRNFRIYEDTGTDFIVKLD